jgi:Zn-finger nucleic acid-binding protein
MTQCVICAREADNGYLCDNDFSKLASTLRQIEDEATVLDASPSFAQRTGPGGSSLASHRSPANLDVIVATDPRRGLMRWSAADDDDLKAFDPLGLDTTASVLETLASRADTVFEEGGFERPARATISGERDYLTRNLIWIASQPWVDEMVTEMRELLGQLQRTNHTQPDRPVGICQLPRFESICGGRIWQREEERVIWHQAEPGSDRCKRVRVKVSDGPAFCERCRNVWDDPTELNRLHLIEEQRLAELARPKTEDGRRMLTGQEMADKLGTSLANMRKIASRKGIRAVLGHYDPDLFAERMTA